MSTVSSGLIISGVVTPPRAAVFAAAVPPHREAASEAAAVSLRRESEDAAVPPSIPIDLESRGPSAASAAASAASHSGSDYSSRINMYYSTGMYDQTLYKKSSSQDEGEAFLRKFDLEGRYKYEHSRKMFYRTGGDRTAYHKLNILQQLRSIGYKDEKSIFFKRKITQQEGDDFLEEYKATDLFMYREKTRSFYFIDNRNKDAYHVIAILLYLKNIQRLKL